MNTSPLPPPIILVVDDDRVTRQMICQTMTKEGYQVVEASNGEEGLAAYQHLQPHIILLDAVMPIMDGFTCCTNLQALPGGDRTPILMITGLDDKASVDQAFTVGATDYITKPIHWPVLLQRVKRLIQQAQLYQKLEAVNQELHRLANSDGLTEVANRHRFEECFEREWRRMAREKLPLSFILCDLDCFKSYNDTYGHQAGDQCLRSVASAISRCAKRPADLVARYGGEEFAIILPNTNEFGALHVAEEIRDQVNALKIPHKGSTVREFVTLSLGVASIIPDHNIPTAVLIKAADEALYQAKREGRDRAILKL
jgi:diguanylate cyclase (GGDEF)-like protein